MLGAVLGWAAWGEGRTPVLAAVVLVLWAASRSSRDAGLLLAGYLLAATRVFAPGGLTFAAEALDAALILAGWLGNGLLIGSLWGGAHRLSRANAPARILAGILLQVALLAPPLWLLGIAHPISAWGYLIPGTSHLGLIFGLVAPLAAGTWLARRARVGRAGASVALVIASSVLSVLTEGGQVGSAQVQGASTRWGSPLGWSGEEAPIDRLPRIAEAVKTAKAAGSPAHTFVWPETALGMASSATPLLMRLELLPTLRRYGATAIIGMDRIEEDRPRVSAVVVRPDGSLEWFDARQPAPISLWRPWDAESYSADWRRRNLVTLSGGERAWISFCHEDVMPGLLLDALWRYKADHIVSIANNWWMPSDEGAQAQAHAIEGIARLYGIPLTRAANLPRLSHGSTGPSAAAR